MAAKKLQEKRADQAKLKQLRRVVITLEASEEILARLAALLTFSTLPYELEEAKPLGPLPYEDPDDPRYIVPQTPTLQIDYHLVRRDIMRVMDAYLTAGGVRENVVTAIRDAGGTKLSDVPEDNLLPLLDSLTRLNQNKDT